MRLLSIIAGLPVAVVVSTFAVSNRQTVTVSLWPFPFEADIPLYIVVLFIAFLAFVMGGLFSWINTHSLRWELRKNRRNIKKLEQKLSATDAHK